MDDTVFDALSRSAGEMSSRRRVIKLLGAGGVAGLLAAPGPIAGDALAKKKRRKPKKTPTTPKTCRPGTRIATLAVPADGSEVFTPVLDKGQRYTLRASGYWSTNGDYMNDAFAAFPFADPRNAVLYYNGVRLGLSVNGGSPDLWGAYSLSHEYSLTVTGDGKRVPMHMLDFAYSDNARLLTVEVFCAAPAAP